VLEHGQEKAELWLSNTPRGQQTLSPLGWARSTLKDIQDPKQPHKSTLLGIAKDFIRLFPKMLPESHHGAPIPVNVVAQPMTATAIEKPVAQTNDLMQFAQILAEQQDRLFDRILQVVAHGPAVSQPAQRPLLTTQKIEPSLPKPKVLVHNITEERAFKELVTREVRRRKEAAPERLDGELYDEVYTYTYKQYSLQTGFSIKKGDHESVLKAIISDKHMPELYSVAYGLWNEPQRLLQVVPKQ
jgi:hypothetical protein